MYQDEKSASDIKLAEGLDCDLDAANDKLLQVFDRFRRRQDVCSSPKTGETSLPGNSNDRDDLGFHEFIKDNPGIGSQLGIYTVNEGVCPEVIFGRSTTPVCEEVGYTIVEAEPGHNFFNLLDLYIRTSSLSGNRARFYLTENSQELPVGKCLL